MPRLPQRRDRRTVILSRDSRGVALVEFALVLPLIAVLLLGMLGYGQHFLLAHTAQQMANDAARATVAGLDEGERRALAVASVSRAIARMPEIARYPVSTIVTDQADTIDVAVRVDATTMPLARATIVPMPDAIIVRHALVRHGGE